MQSPKHGWVMLAAAVSCAALSLSGCAAARTVANARKEPSASPRSLPRTSIAPPEGAAAGIAREPLTGDSASSMVQAMYEYVIAARVANDGSRLLDAMTGPQRKIDRARQDKLACCYTGFPPKSVVVDHVAVLLGAGAQPAHLIAFVQAHLADDVSQAFEDQLVLVRGPDREWRIALMVQATPRAGLRTSAVGGAPRTSAKTAVEVLTDWGRNLESWHGSGGPTDARRWAGRADEFGQHKADALAQMEQRGYATEQYAFGVPDNADVWVARSPEGADVICGQIPQEIFTTATGGSLRQDPARNNWGFMFEPGAYEAFVTQSPYSTCAQTRDGGRTIELLGQDWYAVSGQGERAG